VCMSSLGTSTTDTSASPQISITLAAGDTVTCTFTNTQRGKIIVAKETIPDGSSQSFEFGVNYQPNFFLSDGQSNESDFLEPGTYGVLEDVPVGWDLTGVVCMSSLGTSTTDTSASPQISITLAAGDTVTCTFTNTKRGTIIVEKQTNPNGAPGLFTFTGTAADTIADNGTITVANLVPGTYTSTEADPSPILFALTSIVCNDGTSANPSTGDLATRTATFNLDPGETVKCTFTNTKDFHPGTIGFWKNWRNHYTTAQFQSLINYLKENNQKVFDKNNSWPGVPTPSNCDSLGGTCDDLTIGKVDAILNVGTKTPREQMILAQFTALKFNLAITQLDGTGGLLQKNDDICLAGTVDVSSISGATAFFGMSTPTVQQVVDAVENRWTGKLTKTRSDWKWNLTTSQKEMMIKLLTGINEGTIVTSSGCP
jgi:hypothetical protein